MNETHVTLPIGIFSEGRRLREVVIRPMTGGTQKKLAAKQLRADPIKLLNALLLDCVVSIEGINKLSNGIINDLYIGDRDFLALEIRKVSRGNDLVTKLKCPHCNETLRMTSDLSKDIECVEYNEQDYVVVEDIPQFTVSSPGSTNSGVFTLPKGNDQAAAMRYIMKNPVEGTQVLMFNTLISWNGKDRNELTLSVFDELEVTESDFFMEEYQKMLPGPNFEIPATCPMCQEDLKLELASSDFLFKLRD